MNIAGRDQLFFQAFAKALEAIPRQLCDNCGLDSTTVLDRLRAAHARPDGSGARMGVDVSYSSGGKGEGGGDGERAKLGDSGGGKGGGGGYGGGVVDTFEAFVWEPALVKHNAIAAATEAAALVLSVDETVRNPRSSDPNAGGGGGPPRRGGGGGRGRGMRR